MVRYEQLDDEKTIIYYYGIKLRINENLCEEREHTMELSLEVKSRSDEINAS